MNSQTERLTLQGPAGAIEVARDAASAPDGGAPRGVAVIAHPHPLFGGTMDNKVVQTLARAFVQCGWTAVRFNFRGVGATQGVHDEGRGELQDLLAVVEQVAPAGEGAQPLALAGFSFGAFVTSHGGPSDTLTAPCWWAPLPAASPWPRCHPRPICARWWCTASKTTPWPCPL